jgi:hypothetical protein
MKANTYVAWSSLEEDSSITFVSRKLTVPGRISKWGGKLTQDHNHALQATNSVKSFDLGYVG